MCRPRIALFVEGSEPPARKRERRSLEQIWNTVLPSALNLPAFHRIIPISKKTVISVSPGSLPMTGVLPLDHLLVKELTGDPFDLAVVAWDLVPDWYSEGRFCRWEETLELYRGLARSEVLPELWRQQAERRSQELEGRRTPSDRVALPPLEMRNGARRMHGTDV